jgi:hypothetical protein
MLDNRSTPYLVSKTVLEAISTDTPKLRYLAGSDVKQLLEGKSNMSDEDFFTMMKQNMVLKNRKLIFLHLFVLYVK